MAIAAQEARPDSRALGKFFKYARERYQVHVLKEAGEKRPWTSDPIINTFFFCNVFRRDDKTTKWFVNNVLSKTVGSPSLAVFACVAFRMLNRISTGEAILPHLTGEYRWSGFERSLRDLIKKGPILGPAYMIKTPPGKDKVSGLMPTINMAWRTRDTLAENIIAFGTIEWATFQLKQLPYVGGFMAYEMATDLTYTEVLHGAKDTDTWANPGPGAMRGLVRLFGHGKLSLSSRYTEPTALSMMRQLLDESWDPDHWPPSYPLWSMREVEHTLCEFDKYERARTGQGTMKRLYHG